MTFKMSTIHIFSLGSMLLLTVLLQCMQDPVDNAWVPNEELPHDNVYLYIKSIVQDNSGIFYGSVNNGTIFRFDSADIAADNQPKEFSYLYNCNLYLNKNNLMAISNSNSPWLLQQSHDSVACIELGKSSFYGDTLLPVNMEDSILWLTTKDGEIFSWDGSVMTRRGDLYPYDGSPIKAIFPEDQGFYVFTYENSLLKYGFFEKHRDLQLRSIYFETSKNDSCIVDAIFRLEGHFFIVAEVIYFYGNQRHTALFEMTDNFNSEYIHEFDERPDTYLKNKDTLYIKSSRGIFKLTPQTFEELKSTFNLDGPLFLDRTGRPRLFYTPTRKLITIDSLPGYLTYWWQTDEN